MGSGFPKRGRNGRVPGCVVLGKLTRHCAPSYEVYQNEPDARRPARNSVVFECPLEVLRGVQSGRCQTRFTTGLAIDTTEIVNNKVNAIIEV